MTRLKTRSVTAAAARAPVRRMYFVSCLCVVFFKGELPPLAEVEEILAFIEKIGVDQVALDGGFVAPDVEGGDGSGGGGNGGGGAAAKSAAPPAATEVATTT